MPRELSQLLLEEGMVTPEGMQHALARQAEAGGTLDTALLELGLVAEATLVAALARASDLPSAPLSAYQQVDARARRVFPSKVAERHGLAPFALEGRELSLVATCPVDLGLLDEVSFMLSLHLAPHIGPEWRVRSLIQRLYGGPLAPRLAQLADLSAARGTSPGVVAAAPPPAPVTGEAADGDEGPGPGRAMYLGSRMPEVSEAVAAPGAPQPTRPPPGLSGFARDQNEPLEPLSAALAEALEAFDVEALEPPREAAATASAADRGASAPTGEAPGPLDRTAPPRWTLEQARAALAQARTRDEVVVTTLRYARDFFKFAALFAVTRDAVAGHDALGPEGDARDLARTVAIYADDPGIFHTTIETMAPYLGRVDRAASGNQAVLDALGRGSPRTVLVTPILLRHRPLCLLYADNAAAPVSARRLGDFLIFCSTVGAAFERIIVSRKEPAAESAVPLPAVPAEPTPIPIEIEPMAPIPAPAPAPISAPIPVPTPTPIPAPAPAPAPTLTAIPIQAATPAPRSRPAPVATPIPIAPRVSSSAPPGPQVADSGSPATPGLFGRPEPAWRGPGHAAPPVSDAEAQYVAAGGRLEPDELFAPPPASGPVAAGEPAPALAPEATAEVAPPPLHAAPPHSTEPERLPPEPPLQAEPPADEPEPHGMPDEPAFLVGAYLTTAPGTPARARLLDRLLGHAPATAPILCELLPGPVEVSPEALPTTAVAARGPVLAALAAMGQPAVPSLLALLGDLAPARRLAAAQLLGVIGDPATLPSLADRCLDPDPAVAEAAREALAAQRGAPAMRPIPERLRRALSSGLATRAAMAARALMALRDAESIPNLIQALEGTDPATAAAAAEALGAITLQRHGATPRPWLLWWKQNRGRGRAEWLFGGLTAEDRQVRAAAAAELERVAPPPVPYSPDMAMAERQAAARAWASWFTRSGYRL